MNVTIQQFITLELVMCHKIVAVRMVSNPNKYRYIGTSRRVLNRLMELNWIQEVLVNTQTMTYAPTAEGYRAYAVLKNQKPKGRVYTYGEEN